MQRSGQTAKTQSSAKAPGRRALSPAPSREGRSALPRGQPAGGRLGKRGALGRRGSPSVPHPPRRPGARTAGGTAAPGVTQRSPATLRGTSESFSGRDVRAASPTRRRLRQPPAAGGTPGRAGGGAAQKSRPRRREGATERRDPSEQTSATAELRPGRAEPPCGSRGCRPPLGGCGGREAGNRSPEAVFLPATPAAPASAPRSACGSPAPRPRPAPTRTTRRRRCCCTGTWP